MGKISTNLTFCLLILVIWAANANGLMEEEPLLQNLRGRQKLTKFHFYMHDILAGPNQTVWEVATSAITNSSGTNFGLVRVLDDYITVGPDINSVKLGRAQGYVTHSDLEEEALAMNINFYFTYGKYKGSTLSIVGRNSIWEEVRELVVVGGTGAFRFASGYSILTTYFINSNQTYVILDFAFYVARRDEQLVSTSPA